MEQFFWAIILVLDIFYGNKFKVPPKKLKFTPKILLDPFHNFYD